MSPTSLMPIHVSGRFYYSAKHDLFVVHNLYDGFDAYTMKSRAHFRSYRFPASEKDNVPLSCILINDGRHIVCGTTAGKAVVLNAITLAHQAELIHCSTCQLVASPFHMLNMRDRIRPRSRYSTPFHQTCASLLSVIYRHIAMRMGQTCWRQLPQRKAPKRLSRSGPLMSSQANPSVSLKYIPCFPSSHAHIIMKATRIGSL